jgi:division/cell wall cluster transcriptional repressor MraZ
VQGSSPQTLDGKGRFSIPVAFREELVKLAQGEALALVWNPDGGQLTLYPQQDWLPYQKMLEKIDDFDPVRGPVKDTMLSSLQWIEPKDLGERILISAGLRDMARLEKEKEIIVNMRDRVLQIWNREQWTEHQELARQAFRTMSNFWEGL